ncbi:MAG TPA: hypothetical protein VJX30_10585 [Terriglobales bacterium]|nr:hypothetical protein [Terriglobales bacterium]
MEAAPKAVPAYIFTQIPDTAAAEAFAFFQSVASTDPHMMPRSEGEIQEFANSGELFGVRNAESGALVAMAYATLEERKREWEFGGLIVGNDVQNLGIGTTLTGFVLCSLIANERPWYRGDTVITHVHEDNPDPRNLLNGWGFQPIDGPEGKTVLKGEMAPPSMKRNAEGNVVGDKFGLPRAAVRKLASWINSEFGGLLRDGKTRAIFEVRPSGPDSIKEALKQELAEFERESQRPERDQEAK